MLDLALRLVDIDGNVLALADTFSLGEYVAMEVPAGEYFLSVSSHGSYGDIGQYRISGSVVPEPGAAVISMVVGVLLVRRRPRSVECAGET